MNIKKLVPDLCIYDGIEPAIISVALQNLTLGSFSFNPNELQPISGIGQIDNTLAPDDIAKLLKTETTRLGSLNIYKGTSRGSKLYFITRNGKTFIISYGESQPARFECEINAYIEQGRQRDSQLNSVVPESTKSLLQFKISRMTFKCASFD